MVLPSVSMDNFQLKSTKNFPNNHFPSIITGAEYHATLASLEQGVFPSLILLHYEPQLREVQDGLLIHRLTITRNSISQRAPLKESARRARWTGTNILLGKIPDIGRIPMIQESKIVPKKTVMHNWQSVEEILKGDLDKRGWIAEIMLVLDKLPEIFSLEDVYSYEQQLGSKYPNNKHVKDKIRQQIQVLRDRGYLKFISRGKYLKLRH
jgi:type II restriction enzyme